MIRTETRTRRGLSHWMSAHVFIVITMRLTGLILVSAFLAKPQLGGADASPARTSPNVVLIFSDDMGYSDLPKFGESEIPTPALDRLADDGVIFTDAYVTAPICVASRMGLMTGQYQQRLGIYGNVHGLEKNRLFLQQTLLPELFQRAGYRTGLVGKWHLSGNSQERWIYPGPRERGLDEFVGIRGGGSDFWEGTTVYRGDKAFEAPEYLTDLWGTEACQFIDRNKSHPFFLYLAFNAVHSPMHALDVDQDQFPNVADENRRIYNGMLLAMDRSIGRVLDQLERSGIADNTIVVFLNDNGGGENTERYPWHSRNYANNLPLRGFKFDVLEGGVRVPMIIRWPGKNLKGNVYSKMVSSFDLFPTLLQAAGLNMPNDQHTDGVDLLPYITGENKTAPHEWLCWQNRTRAVREPGGYATPNLDEKEHDCAIRKGKWKLVREAELIDSDNPPPWQLYDLTKDIGEQRDLAEKFPTIVSELNQIFLSWRSSMPPSVELN